MKKIILLLVLLTVSLGYSQQEILEDFEGSPVFAGFEGLGSASIEVDPVDGSNHALQLVTSVSGNGWQGAEVILQGDYMDLTTDITVNVNVYSTAAFTMLAKVEEGGPASAADEAHTGSGWETLTFTFNESLDGTGVANGEYSKFVMFPNWNGSGWHNPPIEITIYVDDITAVPATAQSSCTDGIMNGNETGVDCGGPDCDPCISDAPDPTTPDAEVLSLYSDTGGFTNMWTPDYVFGSFVNKYDLDTSGSADEAIKMDFSIAGYGEGTNSPVDISAYSWVHFDYYAPDFPAGVNGHEFKFILIGDGEGEKDYIFKADATGDDMIVFDSWQSVNIELSHFTDLGLTLPNYLQFKLGSTSDLNTTVVWFDNIYFSVNQGTTGINDIELIDVSVHPNPTQDIWTINTDQNIKRIDVYDITGKMVLSNATNNSSVEIDASSLNMGIYIAKVETSNGTNQVKLIKK